MIQNTTIGAVGRTLARLARSRGIPVINLVRRDAGVDKLAALGIDHAVSTAQAGWQDRVRAIVGEASIRAAVERIALITVGSLAALLLGFGIWRSVRRHGRGRTGTEDAAQGEGISRT